MSIQFALIAAQMYLGIVTQKRPTKHTFQDLLDSNKGDETRPIPYIRGQWKTKPQRIWLGDFSARAVERDSHWSDYVFFGPVLSVLLDTITVGYRYYVGQGFALTWGPINRVHQVYVEDLPCAVTPVVDNAGGSLLLDDPQLFGGDQPPGEGGIFALCDVIAGNYTQGRNAYLQSVEGNIPALRGVAALIIRGRSGFTESGYFTANVLNLREWQVEVMAWPNYLSTGFHRLPDNSYNRIEAMYEWATNADFGAEYPAELIHLPSWREAAETVYNEGNGFSGEINTGGSVGEVFDQLRQSVDAEVYEHPRDGLKLKLIRKDYSLPAIPVLSKSNTNQIEEYTPGDYADTFNRTTLDFTNADNNYQPAVAVYEDPANRFLQRRAASKSIQFPGVTDPELAQKLVTQSGRVLAQPFPPLILNAGEIGRGLWPGDVYKFEWSDPFVEKVFRVHSRTPATSYEGESGFRLTSTEDQYSIGLSVFGTPGGTAATNPADVWDTAPPSASWDDAAIPSNGLRMDITVGLSGVVESFITGAIEFGIYAGGQYARIYVTPPGGTQSLTPIRLSPDANNKAQFVWPALVTGTYEFCVQTFAIVTDATNGVKVCESTLASSFSVSPSASLSPSASESPSISPSSSVSPSASVSPSSSESPSVSPSASASASQSPSSSISPSASTSPSSSASPSSTVPAPEVEFDGRNLTGTDGTEITLWEDSSGNNRDAIEGAVDGPILKTGILNGHSIARWDGNIRALEFTGNATSPTFTVIAVVKCTDGNTRTVLSEGSNGSNAPIFSISTNKIRLWEIDVGQVGISSTSLNTTSFFTVAVTFDDTTNNFAFYLNGSADGSGTQAAAFSRRFSRIGLKGGNLERFLGDIAYVAYWNTVLDSTQLTEVFDDLRAVWAHY